MTQVMHGDGKSACCPHGIAAPTLCSFTNILDSSVRQDGLGPVMDIAGCSAFCPVDSPAGNPLTLNMDPAKRERGLHLEVNHCRFWLSYVQ